MREGIAKWIESDPGLEVCGEFDTTAKGLSSLSKAKPDLVLCDITLAQGSGLEFLKDAKVFDPHLPVVMLSMHDESVYAIRAMRAGARGYVMKQAGGAEVVNAIKQVLAGGHAFSTGVTNQILAEIAGHKRGHKSPVAALTDREFEILQLYGLGKTSGQIAQHLSLSPKTVGTHRLNICQKLDLKSTAELIRFAVEYV